jgi:putative membrane protein insertion efficiency factor
MTRLLNTIGGIILRAPILLYRYTLSYFIGGYCRFLPTCSAYADEAICIHGPITGGKLAFNRLCRCHPWTFLGPQQGLREGFDPVPVHVKEQRAKAFDD